MTRKILLIVFVSAQLFVLAVRITPNQFILKKGTVYKFKAAPVDPYDVFRGRYVAIESSQRSAPLTDEDGTKIDLINKGDAYAMIGVDSLGYAFVERLVADRPKTGDYFKVKGVSRRIEGGARFDFPIDRYYMNEKKAPGAERLYRERTRTRDGQSDVYMLVRVFDGRMVLERLMLDDKPIEDWLK